MSKALEKRLQNLDYSLENLRKLKTFLDTGTLPNDYSEYQKKRYNKLYSQFEERNGSFIYAPLNLEVVKDTDITLKLKAMYNDPEQGFGLGIKTFYNKVTAKYLNITREDVRDFLQSQTVYQLVKAEPRHVNKPIIATYPNQRWAIDLIDVNIYASKNEGNNYILTGIDHFSKKVFAIGIKNKEDQTVVNALEDIVKNQAKNTYPKLLQSDNGLEFKNNLLDAWAKHNNVKLIHTTSYTPTGNALIENFNNILRKMIREGFIRYNTFNWTHHLENYLTNKNNTEHSTTKVTPNSIWQAGLEKRADEPIIQDVRQRIEDRAEAIVKRNTTSEYTVGDKVRVLMGSLYSEVRKAIKAGDQKLIPVKYSPEIFLIKQIIKPKEADKDFQKLRYTLNHQNGNVVITQEKLNKTKRKRGPQYFFATELQLVNNNDPTDVLKPEEAEILNNNDIAAYNKVQQKKREPRQQVKRVDDRPHNIILTRQRTKETIEETPIQLPRKRGRPRKII